MAKLYTDVKSVIETNLVNSVRTGQVKAQYDFVGDKTTLENGMLLVEDSLNREIRFPFTGTEMCYLNASEERIYEDHLGRKEFGLQSKDLPKVYKLKVGDIFETNAVDGGNYADVAAVKADLANGIFGIPSTSGLIELVDATEGAAAMATHCVVLQIVEFVTLPNEAEGIKFVVKQAKKVARVSSLAAISVYQFLDVDNVALSADVVGVIDGNDIALTVPAATDVTALVADFTISANATIAVDGVVQVSGTTANDFTEPVVYTVTAQSGATQEYTVTVTIAA